jgi:HD superfamily phosphohydrolase
VNSQPYQRLRNIHQLAMTHFIYPGATHTRFEHALGVMELAGRVYDVVTNAENVHSKIQEIDLIPRTPRDISYWRQALRMAALCHDLGHSCFSHGPEHLFPVDENGKPWSHERMSYELIVGPLMKPLWDDMKLVPEDVGKLAIGKKETSKFDSKIEFSTWEAIVSEIVVGDAFGVDRMDYLLRDSLHAGVAYGRFDHYRLIDTLRILPASEESAEPKLGVEHGGLHSAEQLLLARYFMFTQVYLHPVRRAYDKHLVAFLEKNLPSGKFPTDPVQYLSISDNEILADIAKHAQDTGSDRHKEALLIHERHHYKKLWQRNAADRERNDKALDFVVEAAKTEFGPENVIRDAYPAKNSVIHFPVWTGSGIEDSVNASDVLKNIPPAVAEFVLIRPDLLEAAKKWLQEKRLEIIPLQEKPEVCPMCHTPKEKQKKEVQ